MDARPDGSVGVMAIEGIKDAEVILHGPDSCRKNLNILSSKRKLSPPEREHEHRRSFLSRILQDPCTGIISTDYIYGSYDKIESALEFVGRGDSEFIAVVCSEHH